MLSPELRVADVEFNCTAIIDALATRRRLGCRLALFPELSLTGYSCGDLFYQALLLERAGQALGPLPRPRPLRYRCGGRAASRRLPATL